MNKLIKIILSLLAFVFLAIVAGIFFLNPIVNKLKPQIENSISNIVKQDVKISNIEAKVFSEIGVKLSRVKLENNVAKRALSSGGQEVINKAINKAIKKGLNKSIKKGLNKGNRREFEKSNTRVRS